MSKEMESIYRMLLFRVITNSRLIGELVSENAEIEKMIHDLHGQDIHGDTSVS